MTEPSEQPSEIRKIPDLQADLEKIEKALQVSPESVELLSQKAVILETVLKDYNRALETYKTILAKEPERLTALSAAGLLSYLMGDDEGALHYLKKLTDLCPDFSATAWRILGRVRARQEKRESARLFFEKALSLNPGLHQAAISLALIHADQKDYRTALHLLDSLPENDASWKRNPYYTEWLLAKARALRGCGRPQEAYDLISDYCTVCRDIRGLKEKAFAAADLGRNEEALGILSEISQRMQNIQDPEIIRRTAKILYSMNRLSDSLHYWELLSADDPENTEVMIHKAEILSRMRKDEEAASLYEHLLQRYPEDIRILFSYAVSLDRTGRFGESYDIYKKITGADPDFGGAWNNFGYVCYRLNRYEEAAVYYTKSIECRPDFAGAWYNRACVHALSGKVREALADLSEAVQLRSRYRRNAASDPDFDSLRNLNDFINIIKDQRDSSQESNSVQPPIPPDADPPENRDSLPPI